MSFEASQHHVGCGVSSVRCSGMLACRVASSDALGSGNAWACTVAQGHQIAFDLYKCDGRGLSTIIVCMFSLGM